MHSAPAIPETAYDLVPYKSNPFPQSHPDRLATVATLFGLRPASISHCRVLELGCASGGNLLPMADQFSESEFLGIDASSRQIAQGQDLINRSGLKNIELRCQDILEFHNDQAFDYIICHGVYSWVPAPVQQKILEVCQRFLTADGIAYVSYNTYPGWHMRGMIRDIMKYRAQSFDDPRQKLNQARGLLAFLSNSVKGEQNPYGLLLKQELESISRKEDSYLLHEYLEEVNEPIYFHEFARRASVAGLQYLGESHFGVMSPENFPPEVRETLRSVSRDSLEIEQYMDFLRNRAFRQSLLCHDKVRFNASAQYEQLVRLRVSSNAKPEASTVNVRSTETVVYRRGNGKLTSSDPIVKAAMQQLLQAWPDSIPFVELASIARATATGKPSMVDTDLISPVTEPFARTMLRCFGTSMIDLRCTSQTFVRHVSERPMASPLARAQAEHGTLVTNRLHESMTLDDVQRQVLQACDGQHTMAELIEILVDKVISGVLVQHHEGQRVTDRHKALELASDIVPSILQNLAQKATLIA